MVDGVFYRGQSGFTEISKGVSTSWRGQNENSHSLLITQHTLYK